LPSSRAAQRPVHVTGIDRRREGARAVGAKRLEHQRDEPSRGGGCRFAGRLDDPGIRHQQEGQVFGELRQNVLDHVGSLSRAEARSLRLGWPLSQGSPSGRGAATTTGANATVKLSIRDQY
jgi:hypothetical protein